MGNDYKAMFPRAGEVAYLDTAAEGLPLAAGRDALLAYFEDKSMGTPGRPRLHDQEQAAIEAVGRLLGASPANVALLASASDAFNIFANSIAWRAGDEVVVTDLEFPSGVLAWLRLRERGVRVRVIPASAGALSLESFAAAIGPSTRVVCVSYVSYKSGTRIPFLRGLAELTHRHGAMLVLDATQALGRLPVNIEGVDLLVASTYKWLLGVHGLGVVYLAAEAREKISEGAVGWYSVANLFAPDRFERYDPKPGAGWMMTGMPAFPPIYVLRRSVEFLLDAGIERLDAALRPLMARLREGVAQLGFDLLTPAGAQYASGIVSFLHPECKRIGAALEQEGVIVWSGDGRVRASVHLYNDRDDVDRLLDALARVTGKERACSSRS